MRKKLMTNQLTCRPGDEREPQTISIRSVIFHLSRNWCRTVAVVVVAICGIAASEAIAKPVYNKPFYNPETKSYFELVELPPGRMDSTEFLWSTAMRYAASRVYKGAKGRLAIVKSQATHDFIAEHLQPDYPTWIGLRYMCETHTLVWSDGSNHPASGFKRWAPNWRSDKYFCDGGKGYGPIYYGPVNGVLYWHAVGQNKGFRPALIEYPTGQE